MSMIVNQLLFTSVQISVDAESASFARLAKVVRNWREDIASLSECIANMRESLAATP
jgi:hypothetical protein